MGGETEVVVNVFKAIVWVLTAPYSELAPYIDRVLYLFLVMLVLKLMWRKIMK